MSSANEWVDLRREHDTCLLASASGKLRMVMMKPDVTSPVRWYALQRAMCRRDAA
jgi:predicted secreted Zn-dependent protease